MSILNYWTSQRSAIVAIDVTATEKGNIAQAGSLLYIAHSNLIIASRSNFPFCAAVHGQLHMCASFDDALERLPFAMLFGAEVVRNCASAAPRGVTIDFSQLEITIVGWSDRSRRFKAAQRRILIPQGEILKIDDEISFSPWDAACGKLPDGNISQTHMVKLAAVQNKHAGGALPARLMTAELSRGAANLLSVKLAGAEGSRLH